VPRRPSPARCRAESSEAITRAPSHHAARSLCRSLEAIAGAPLRPEPQSPSRSAVTSQDLRRHHRSVVTPFAPTSTRAPPRYEISKDVTGASALSELRSRLPKRCRGTKHPKPSKNSCRAQSLEVLDGAPKQSPELRCASSHKTSSRSAVASGISAAGAEAPRAAPSRRPLHRRPWRPSPSAVASRVSKFPSPERRRAPEPTRPLPERRRVPKPLRPLQDRRRDPCSKILDEAPSPERCCDPNPKVVHETQSRSMISEAITGATARPKPRSSSPEH
jgi:hypothetical protein